jgi:dTDP-glucose 4,6-dehydratase
LEKGHRVICLDNLDTGSLQNIEHLRNGEDFLFVNHDVTEPYFSRSASTTSSTSLAGEPDRLPAPAPAHAQGRLLRDAQHARPGQVQARALPHRLDERGLRRPAGAPQPETYWGHVNPIGPRGVYDEAKRYAEALDDGLPPPAGRRHLHRAHLQHLRAAHAPHDGRAIPTFIRQALENKPLTVFGDGSQTRSFCYVDDLIRGLYALATSGEHLPSTSATRPR